MARLSKTESTQRALIETFGKAPEKCPKCETPIKGAKLTIANGPAELIIDCGCSFLVNSKPSK